MDNVKRYGHIGYLVNASEKLLELYPDMTVYVKAADFDRVTAERDAQKEYADRADSAIAQLQQRLTAADERADERADVLEGLLRLLAELPGVRTSGIWERVVAALKPAEGGGDER